MKSRLFLFLVCMVCMAAALMPVALAAGEYMGGDVVIGGSGPYSLKVTEVPAAAAQGTAATVPPVVAPATGSLSVTTTPAGATIFIDGVWRGVSPATVPGLAPGSHTLLLMMNGYNDLTATVTITAGQTATYTTDLPLFASTALPATKKTPGFGVIAGLAAVGAMFLTGKRAR